MTDTQIGADLPYVFIEAFGLWATPDGRTFTSEADAISHTNRDAIEQDVQVFMAYVDAHPERFFTLAGKRQSTKRDGSTVPARPGRIMEGRALKAVRTRLENTARLIYSGIPDAGGAGG